MTDAEQGQSGEQRPGGGDGERWILREKLKLLYAQAPLAQVSTLFLVALTAGVMWRYSTPVRILGWAAGLVAVTFGRMILVQAFRRAGLGRRNALRWARLYLLGVFAAAVAWGSAALLLYPADSTPGQMLLAFILCGISAGAATVLAALPGAYVYFAPAALLPLTVRLMAHGDSVHLAMGLLVVVYGSGLGYAVWYHHTALVNALLLRQQNLALTERLNETSVSLEGEIGRRREVGDQIRQRDAILQAVTFAAGRLLPARSWMAAGPEIFRRLGEATGVSRVHLFAVYREAEGSEPEGAYLRQVLEWTAPGLSSQADNPQLQQLSVAAPGLTHWVELLSSGQIVAGITREFPGEEREMLLAQEVRSTVMVPIFVSGQWWGYIAFDDCAREHGWSPVEIETLRAAADTLGAAIQGGRAEEALRESEERFRLLAEHTHDLVGLHNPDGAILYFTPSCIELLGYQPGELVGRNPYDLFHPDDRERIRSTAHEPVLEGLEPDFVSYRIQRKTGEYIWFETTTRAITDDAGEVVRLVTSSRDVTLRKQAEEQLFHEKELAQVTLQSIGDGVITTDAQARVQYLNPVAAKLIGWTLEEAVGLPLAELFYLQDEVTETPIRDVVERTLAPGGRAGDLPDHAFLIARGGDRFAVQLTATPIRDRKGEIVGCVSVFRDITRTRELAQQLTYQATHDPLTGLINRRELEERLHRSLARADGRPPYDVLCYLDLDQFKLVNDTCGHVAGDELLRQLTRLLQARARPDDSVARLGGDEFGLLLSRCSQEQAVELANEICQQIREVRFTWKDKVFTVGASIGVVVLSPQMEDVASVLKAADTACYAAKDRGRNRVHLYHTDDRELARRHGEMEWISRIHRALADDRLELLFQPIRSTRSSDPAVRRIEILLSMRDLGGQQIPPGSFIPAAEHYNLMPTIDRWVIRKTLDALAPYWRGYRDCPLKTCFINLSSTSLADPGFLEFLKAQLSHHRIPPGAICFEITETAAITNLTDALHFIEEVRRFGCYFALDDFGSGLSSFAHLKAMPVDYLKIDGTFVRDLLQDPTDRALVESINRIGHLLGLQTIAEFVESEEILRQVAALDIDFVQGYAIARPAPLGELLRSLEPHRQEGELSLSVLPHRSLGREEAG